MKLNNNRKIVVRILITTKKILNTLDTNNTNINTDKLIVIIRIIIIPITIRIKKQNIIIKVIM